MATLFTRSVRERTFRLLILFGKTDPFSAIADGGSNGAGRATEAKAEEAGFTYTDEEARKMLRAFQMRDISDRSIVKYRSKLTHIVYVNNTIEQQWQAGLASRPPAMAVSTILLLATKGYFHSSHIGNAAVGKRHLR